jgi:hypothetical protein
MTAVVTWHGPDAAHPPLHKVIVRRGSIVQHHGQLDDLAYARLLANPSLDRPGAEYVGAKAHAAIAALFPPATPKGPQ